MVKLINYCFEWNGFRSMIVDSDEVNEECRFIYS